jgi:hypothetical protein
MTNHLPQLLTPIYIKDHEDQWYQDDAFYLLCSNGLYFCRNNACFRSCVPCRNGPSELAPQFPFLELNFPKIPSSLLERIVGFFWHVHCQAPGAEAILLLAWDAHRQSVQPVVPLQIATIGYTGHGQPVPWKLEYTVPIDLPPDWIIFADIHSHCMMGPFSSLTDRDDESTRPGLHFVVGQIDREPPRINVEAVMDGVRFRVVLDDVVEPGYRCRNAGFPQEWLQSIQIRDGRSSEPRPLEQILPVAARPNVPSLDRRDLPPDCGKPE